MALNFNGNSPSNITYNGLNVRKLIYNNDVVWSKEVYGSLYKISDDEYHLIFNSTGNLAKGYTQSQLIGTSNDISGGSTTSQIWNNYTSLIKKAKIEEKIIPSNTQYYFYNLSEITEIEGLENINTSNVTDMKYMFGNCTGLTSLNVSSFNTSNVTDMQFMFRGCSNLTSVNLSNWDTSNVTNMRGVFYQCPGLTSLNVSSFNTSNVTDMLSMFNGCTNLTSLDLSNFNTSQVTTMNYMFYNCTNLTTIYVGARWTTSAVTSSVGMFLNSTSIVGAIAYNSSVTDKTNAKWDKGYLTYKAKELTEYQNLQNIASSGTQYINTGVAGNNSNLSIEIQYQWITIPDTGVYRYIIGNHQSADHNSVRILQYEPSTTYFNLNSKSTGGSGTKSTTRNTSTIYTESLSCTNDTMTYNSNGTVTTRARADGTENNENICVFSSINGSTKSSIKLYYLKIYDNGTLIRDFVPCKIKADNTVGLYDAVSGVFYPNKGTGNFTAGPNV